MQDEVQAYPLLMSPDDDLASLAAEWEDVAPFVTDDLSASLVGMVEKVLGEQSRETN